MKVVGIIPARYDSSRLPGKPLEMIGGKSLIMRVYEQCMKVDGFEEVVVATDDERILSHVQESGGKAVITSSEHGSGTERCEEAMGKISVDFDFVINVQGDEPFINPSHITKLISTLTDRSEIGTLCMPIQEKIEIEDPNIPKVVRDTQNNALYFSRSVIPYDRDSDNQLDKGDVSYFKHIGIYAYRKDILATIVDLPPSSLEKCEQLEQLRWLYNGVRISVDEIPYEESVSVDTPQDLENARKIAERI